MTYSFLRELRRFFILVFIRPVLLVCGAFISSVYKILFAWWLDGWTAKGLQSRLEQDIRKEYAWLFEEYDARIVPTKPYRQVLDYVAVTTTVGDLLFQFIRGREEFRVSVAPAHAPHDWYDFGEAIALACDDESIRNNVKCYRMSDFRSLFEANIGRLKFYFSREEYGQSRRDRTAVRLIPL